MKHVYFGREFWVERIQKNKEWNFIFETGKVYIVRDKNNLLKEEDLNNLEAMICYLYHKQWGDLPQISWVEKVNQTLYLKGNLGWMREIKKPRNW